MRTRPRLLPIFPAQPSAAYFLCATSAARLVLEPEDSLEIGSLSRAKYFPLNPQLGEADPDRYRPAGCPLCGAKKPLIAHGCYGRNVVAEGFDGWIRVRRYLCRLCQRTVSLLPEFVLPYVRFAISLIGRFLEAHLLKSQTLRQAAQQAGQEQMPYQRVIGDS